MGALIVKLLHDIVGFVDTPNNSGLDKDLLGIFGEEITYLVCWMQSGSEVNTSKSMLKA